MKTTNKKGRYGAKLFQKYETKQCRIFCRLQLTATHRFDVAVQEAHRVDALDGLQHLSAQTQGGADAEGSPGHAPPQVSQVATLRERTWYES